MNNSTLKTILVSAALPLLILLWLTGGEITAQSPPAGPALNAQGPVDPAVTQRMLSIQAHIAQLNSLAGYLEYRLSVAESAVELRASTPPILRPPAAAPAPAPSERRQLQPRERRSEGPLNLGTSVPSIKRITRDANGNAIIEYDNQVITTSPNNK